MLTGMLRGCVAFESFTTFYVEKFARSAEIKMAIKFNLRFRQFLAEYVNQSKMFAHSTSFYFGFLALAKSLLRLSSALSSSIV